jgi:nicotinate-nucleotide adenylyltransferase
MKNRSTAFFGGSFDPPHLCHVLVAALGLSSDAVDDILVAPCFAHPFNKKMATFEHRLEMCRRAFAPFGPRVEVSDIERSLGGSGRTLNTLQELHKRFPKRAFRLLVGSDILQEKDSWYRFEEVALLAPPLVVGRAGQKPGAGIVLPDVSSSQVRSLLVQGQDPAGLLPAAVHAYVLEHQLYLEGPQQ